MNVAKIVPTEVAGFCDVATGECVVIETDSDTPHDPATGEIAQLPDVADDESGVSGKPSKPPAA